MILKTIYTVPQILRWFIFVLYLFAIAYASLSPPEGIPQLFYFPHIDKVVHFIMYFGFSLLGLWTLDKSKIVEGKVIGRNNQLWLYLKVLLMAIMMGFAIEIFQRLMPFGRMYSLYDMYANTTGALLGTGLYYLITKGFQNTK